MGNSKNKEAFEAPIWDDLLLPNVYSSTHNIAECKWLYVPISALTVFFLFFVLRAIYSFSAPLFSLWINANIECSLLANISRASWMAFTSETNSWMLLCENLLPLYLFFLFCGFFNLLFWAHHLALSSDLPQFFHWNDTLNKMHLHGSSRHKAALKGLIKTGSKNV